MKRKHTALKRLYILGAGGFAGEVVDVVERLKGKRLELRGLYDDRVERQGSEIGGYKVLGAIRDYVSKARPSDLFVCLQLARIRPERRFIEG